MPNFFENLKNKSIVSDTQPVEPEVNDSEYFKSLKSSPKFQEQQEPIPQESKLRSATRQALRTGARGVETLAGGVGELVRPVQGLLENFMSKVITGKPITEEQREKIRKFYAESEEGMQPFPTTQEVREIHEPFTKEYLKPKTPAESKSDEITEDIVSTISSGLAKAIIGAGLGQGAKYITEEATGSEKSGNIAKSLTMFLTGLWNPKRAQQLTSKYYSAREAAIPVGVTGDATKLEGQMLRLANKVRQSGANIAESEKSIANAAENLVSDIRDGQLSYQKAVAHKRSINENFDKFIHSTPSKLEKARARKLQPEINREIEKFIETSKDKYPQFYDAHKKADRAFGALAAGRRQNEYLRQVFRSKPFQDLSEKVVAAITKPWELGVHVYKSPEIRNLYAKILYATATENASQILRNAKKMEKLLDEDEEVRKMISED